MKILAVNSLEIPEIKIIRFARFCDHRGYFTETFRHSDFRILTEMAFMKVVQFVQMNESYSKAGTIRGLHFQWNPYMGKLVRTIIGHMVDLILDIRKGSPTCGKIIGYDMPSDPQQDFQEWIWVPPGFAHGNFFLKDTTIEYLCSGEYSRGCEAGISPMAADIDWSLCDPGLRRIFEDIVRDQPIITDKDKNGLLVTAWSQDERSMNFVYPM